MAARPRIARTLKVRLVDNIQVEDRGHDSPCWIWQLKTDKRGYGRMVVKTKNRFTHRVAYEEFVGPIPDGLTLHHKCFVHECLNPAHLEPMTLEENCSLQPSAFKIRCKRGHPYDVANTYIRPTGQRDCRKCQAARQRAYQQRKHQQGTQADAA